jgi:hypothetical protein
MNLITNASEALGPWGAIEVSTSLIHIGSDPPERETCRKGIRSPGGK